MKYAWRRMSERQRNEALEYRKTQRYPRHSLPHFDSEIECTYILSAATYEHVEILSMADGRMNEVEQEILELCELYCTSIYAWVFLFNHYHILLRTDRMKELRKEIGRFNGRSAFKWNGQDDARGRIVWRNCFERKIRSQRHFHASVNYILQNPVRHGYAVKWEDWPWSNAKDYLETVGRDEAIRRWKAFPVLDYGKGWDD